MRRTFSCILILVAGVCGAQPPQFEMITDPFGDTGFEPIGFGGGADLIGIREHAEGGWEYAALTKSGIDVFDFAALDPSRPRAAGFRGDWYLFEGLDPTKRDHRLAITRDGRMNEAWAPFEGSRLESVRLGFDGTIAAIDYDERRPTGFSNGILVFRDGEPRFIPGSEDRALHGITADGRFFAWDDGHRSSLWSEDGAREQVPVPYAPGDFVLPSQFVSSHGVPVVDIDYFSPDTRSDTKVTYINGKSTGFNIPPAVFNVRLSDAALDGVAVGSHFDDRFWDWPTSPPLQRGSLWLDGELYLLDDLVDQELSMFDTISGGRSISTNGEILAILERAGEPAAFVILRPIPAPGGTAVGVAVALSASRRRR